MWQEAAAARNIAYCITQLALTDKAVRRLVEQWRSYHTALSHSAVLTHFQVTHHLEANQICIEK